MSLRGRLRKFSIGPCPATNSPSPSHSNVHSRKEELPFDVGTATERLIGSSGKSTRDEYCGLPDADYKGSSPFQGLGAPPVSAPGLNGPSENAGTAN
jgi:hypothetical protein